MIFGIAIVLQQPRGHIMSFAEYSRIHRPLPYILKVTESKGELIYFGIRHSRDSLDPQFKQLRKLWLSEGPKEILNEDITAQPHGTLEESIRYDGERGALAFWAKQDRVPLRSIDMTWKEEASALCTKFPRDQVKLFYLIRGLQQDLKRPNGAGSGRTAEQLAQGDLQMLASQGLDWSPRNVSEIDQVWKATGIKGDWRQPDIAWIDPTNKGPLNKISVASSEVRDEHMVQVLRKDLRDGKKIFAVVGASHVVMQEPALPGRVTVVGNR